ncbi:nitroreductase family deazaflavin-dependent oxidoreductase [Rubrobacter indicoceani]|uniref:nitroreductase family deazaflavin-dependent oxidoreductase n=1 Tax=Rubrobacter indicoceani TaxID=2051957 RepID=UPI000E5A1D69|nr:nitroreductase family deazaflavin-dependent oxidoreductase [Rubrobacter indicoceani]
MAARGRADTPLMRKVQKYATKLHTAVFKASRGRIGSRMVGSPVLILLTTGRKSGQRRETPLLYLPDGEDFAIVASNGGTARAPAWYLNLKADPEVEVLVGGERLAAVAEEVHGDKKRRLWAGLVEMYPTYTDYRRKTEREIPVVFLRRTF